MRLRGAGAGCVSLWRGEHDPRPGGGLRGRPGPRRPSSARRVRRFPSVHPRRLPAHRVLRAGRRPRRARVRPDRGREDRGRRVRRAPRARARPAVLLHHADQGAEQPEVRRPRRPPRRRRRRPAHRRHQRQRRRPGGGDDHRGAAQHDLRAVRAARAARLRGDGRGALPGRPVPRRGVGGGDPPAARARRAGQPVGDGEQRRGVRRLAGHRPRRHHGRRRRAPAGAAVAAHDGRQPAARPVRVGPAVPTASFRSIRSWSAPPATWTGRPPPRSGTGRAGRAARRRPGGSASGRRRGSPCWTGWTATGCCRRSPSCSAAQAATPPWPSACAPGCG